MSGENTSNYKEQGGARDVIGGSLDVVSGGDLDIESGGALKVAGNDITNALDKLHPANRGEVVAATNAITAAESGKVFFLNHATEFVSTLPAPAIGLRYTFIVAAVPSGASYTVVTESSANIMRGHVVSSQDAGGTSDYETTGGDTVTFVDGKADLGDRVDVECDGTYWYVRGSCATFDAITISTAS